MTFSAFFTLVTGHGNIVKPASWADAERKEWMYDEEGNDNLIGCGVQNMPDDIEFTTYGGAQPDCLEYWFSNNVNIPESKNFHMNTWPKQFDHKLPYEYSQPEVLCLDPDGSVIEHDNNPWMAPGTAPVFSPCGAMGGNPNGCHNDGKGSFGDICPCEYARTPRDPFNRYIMARNSGKVDMYNCGSFAFGMPAEQYSWPNAPTTEWKAGSVEDVAWYMNGNHAGGYSYRICKTPEGGISDLTEKCFQNSHLEFVGDKQWVEYEKDKRTGLKTEMDAKRTTKGTFPPNSMWSLLPLIPGHEEGGSSDTAHGHIMDKVQVPSSLEPGEYVLSMRYDSKCSAEVFSFCSNIRITN